MVDPLALKELLWPKAQFYDKQRQMIYSVEDDDETYVVAGNQLGKDFTAGFIVLSFMLRRLCLGNVKVVTTSVKADHLDVLWGEIDRWIRTSAQPLTADKGGPLVYLHQEIRPVVGGAEEKDSYIKGQVSKKGEGMAGHHAASTLLVVDEASGVDDVVYSMAQGWAKRMLVFGNPNPAPQTQFFHKGVKAGNLLASDEMMDRVDKHQRATT